ncbi:hypothetical protein ACHAW6_000035 [Cyclotella cf. meneghiniana]
MAICKANSSLASGNTKHDQFNSLSLSMILNKQNISKESSKLTTKSQPTGLEDTPEFISNGITKNNNAMSTCPDTSRKH